MFRSLIRPLTVVTRYRCNLTNTSKLLTCNLFSKHLSGRFASTEVKTNGINTDESIFQKIMKKKINSTIIFEDDQCIVIEDVNPQAKVHLLVIPRRRINRLSESSPEDQSLLGHLLFIAQRSANLKHLDDFRIVINDGESAGQSVFHLHIHVLGGRNFSWPPG
ncbi:hypothetical protein SNEBB_007693 [Seison nebaliae]|nr:hypothetical protein SNEBB_007693 [Seison nebaliae]